MRRPSRTPTTLAVGFLSLDALLLGYAGVAWGRPLLVVAGAACALGVALVIAGWRRYRRTIAEPRPPVATSRMKWPRFVTRCRATTRTTTT
jgi:hypothetical protein